MTFDFVNDVNNQIARYYESGIYPHELAVLGRHYPIPSVTKDNKVQLEALLHSRLEGRTSAQYYYDAYYERGLSCSAIADEKNSTPSLASTFVQDVVKEIAREWVTEQLAQLKQVAAKDLEAQLSPEVLNTSIKDLDLSARCVNRFLCNSSTQHILTLKDLLLLSTSDFGNIRNMGKDQIAEAVSACQRITNTPHLQNVLEVFTSKKMDTMAFLRKVNQDSYQKSCSHISHEPAPKRKTPLAEQMASAAAKAGQTAGRGGRTGPDGPGGR